MEKICKNCRLYNEKDGVCSVHVVIGGESYELPVLPKDSCHWERVDAEVQQELDREIRASKELPMQARKYFSPRLEEEKDYRIEVKQIRSWSDGKNGFIET